MTRVDPFWESLNINRGKNFSTFPFILYPSPPESPASLLVHLCPWCHAIHRHEEDLARLDDPEEHLQVMEDVSKNLLLRNAKVDILVVRVGALMNNPVHVQIEIVKFWNLESEKCFFFALDTSLNNKGLGSHDKLWEQ